MKIEGQTVDQNGQPVASVNVEFYDGPTVIAAARSGPDGHFEFQNDAPFPGRPILAKASAKGFAPAEQTVGDAAGELRLVLQREPEVVAPPIGKYAAIVGAITLVVVLGVLLWPRNSVPELTLELNPSKVRLGKSSTLTWSSKKADKVTIEPLGELPPSGSTNLTPSALGSVSYKGSAFSGSQASAPVEVVLDVLEKPHALIRITQAQPRDTSVREGQPVVLELRVANSGELASGPLVVSASVTKRVRPGLGTKKLADAHSATALELEGRRSTTARPTPVAGTAASAKKSTAMVEATRLPTEAILAEFVQAPITLTNNFSIQPGANGDWTLHLWSTLPKNNYLIKVALVPNGEAYEIDHAGAARSVGLAVK